MPGLLSCWFTIQRSLFPALEDELGPLSDTEERFVRVVALLDIGPWMLPFRWKFTGRKPEDRHAILKAFLAKAVWNFPTPRAPSWIISTAPPPCAACADGIGPPTFPPKQPSRGPLPRSPAASCPSSCTPH